MATRQPRIAPKGHKMTPGWLKMVSIWSQDGLKMVQDGSKMLKMTPCWLKMVSRWSKMAPKWLQDASRQAHLGLRQAQDGSQKALQDDPMLAQDGLKMAPRWLQDGPRQAQLGLRQPQDGSQKATTWLKGELTSYCKNTQKPLVF